MSALCRNLLYFDYDYDWTSIRRPFDCRLTSIPSRMAVEPYQIGVERRQMEVES